VVGSNQCSKNLSFSQGKRSHSQDIFFRKFLMSTKKNHAKKPFFLNQYMYIFLDAVSENLFIEDPIKYLGDASVRNWIKERCGI
jgi:hypothetical protein